jgi:hypothetical protein
MLVLHNSSQFSNIRWDGGKRQTADLGNIGARYTTANGFYLSVITALLGVLALAKADGIFAGQKAYLGLASPLSRCSYV